MAYGSGKPPSASADVTDDVKRDPAGTASNKSPIDRATSVNAVTETNRRIDAGDPRIANPRDEVWSATGHKAVPAPKSGRRTSEAKAAGNAAVGRRQG
jgi:hypothetical protein